MKPQLDICIKYIKTRENQSRACPTYFDHYHDLSRGELSINQAIFFIIFTWGRSNIPTKMLHKKYFSLHFTGINLKGNLEAVSGVDIAVQYINNQTEILPNTHMKMLSNFTENILCDMEYIQNSKYNIKNSK